MSNDFNQEYPLTAEPFEVDSAVSELGRAYEPNLFLNEIGEGLLTQANLEPLGFYQLLFEPIALLEVSALLLTLLFIARLSLMRLGIYSAHEGPGGDFYSDGLRSSEGATHVRSGELPESNTLSYANVGKVVYADFSKNSAAQKAKASYITSSSLGIEAGATLSRYRA